MLGCTQFFNWKIKKSIGKFDIILNQVTDRIDNPSGELKP